MKVILETSENIYFNNIDPVDGIIITTNPRGVIQRVAEDWEFFLNSDGEEPVIIDANTDVFVHELIENYPNINVEYYPCEE